MRDLRSGIWAFESALPVCRQHYVSSNYSIRGWKSACAFWKGRERLQSLMAHLRLCGFPALSKHTNHITAGKFHSDNFWICYLGVLILCYWVCHGRRAVLPEKSHYLKFNLCYRMCLIQYLHCIEAWWKHQVFNAESSNIFKCNISLWYRYVTSLTLCLWKKWYNTA